MSRWFWTFLLGTASALTASAAVKVNPLFTDSMVLQQNLECPVWGTATPGEKISVSLSPSAPVKGDVAAISATADEKGNWMVKLPKRAASSDPSTLTIKGENTITLKDVLIGEVWICSGQSNMEWPLNRAHNPAESVAAANNPMLRLFTVQRTTAFEPQTTVVGKWAACTPQTAGGFSAVAYYFGRDLQAALKVPVGLIHTSWGGTPAQAWTSQEALKKHSELKGYVVNYNVPEMMKKYQSDSAKYLDMLAAYIPKAKDALEKSGTLLPLPAAPTMPVAGPGQASTLFNAMLAPLVPYGIAGAIWYQGESNAGQAYQYRTLFTAMIQDWRDQWGQGDFPFMLVQLAPFMKIVTEPTESNWAELRESQWYATKILKKVGMAVITDVGEEFDIHPTKKEPVGARLAIAARNIAYGEKIAPAGPEFKDVKFTEGQAIISFGNVGKGLVKKGEELTGFTLAGEDKKFVNATAKIVGDTVVVTAEGIKEPKIVRFGWANFPVVNLWNEAGLPATPFRSDMPK